MEVIEWLDTIATQSPAWLILALAAATVASEDIACVAAGVLAARGVFSFPMAVSGCLLGIVLSDVGLFLMGKWWGEKIIRFPPISWWVTSKRLDLGKSLYRKYGGMLVVVSRFLPGTRMMAYIAAGMLGYPWKRFVAFMAVACAIWTPIIVGFSMTFGRAILDWQAIYQRWAIPGLILTILLLWLFLKLVLPLFSEEGREAFRRRWAKK